MPSRGTFRFSAFAWECNGCSSARTKLQRYPAWLGFADSVGVFLTASRCLMWVGTNCGYGTVDAFSEAFLPVPSCTSLTATGRRLLRAPLQNVNTDQHSQLRLNARIFLACSFTQRSLVSLG